MSFADHISDHDIQSQVDLKWPQLDLASSPQLSSSPDRLIHLAIYHFQSVPKKINRGVKFHHMKFCFKINNPRHFLELAADRII